MRFSLKIVFFLFCCRCFAADFDVVVVGTSPICLLEALYCYHSGNRVAILEEADVCGGAWRSIDICGVKHVDLGCHQLWSNQTILKFLEVYVGCKTVSLDDPHRSFEASRSPSGFYLSGGCYEMVSNLLHLIQKTGIELIMNHPLEVATISPHNTMVHIKAKELEFTAAKVLYPTYSYFKVEDFVEEPPKRTKFYHLYLLIEDSTPPHFTFRNGGAAGVSRMMNLTYFVGLEGSGKQLFVFQTNAEPDARMGQTVFDSLKREALIDSEARFLQAEPYIYEYYRNSRTDARIKKAPQLFECLSTAHINFMENYISKWMKILKPFNE